MKKIAYRVVTSFAGVKWGRASSFLPTFAEANRMAMANTAKTGKASRVYAGIPGDFALDLVAEYVKGSEIGLVQSVPIDGSSTLSIG